MNTTTLTARAFLSGDVAEAEIVAVELRAPSVLANLRAKFLREPSLADVCEALLKRGYRELSVEKSKPTWVVKAHR